MTISKDLFLSILAMDAYNRGYGAGIADGKGAKDGDGRDADGLGEAGSPIGGATVLDVDIPTGSQAAGFYAVAYEVNGVEGIADGTRVISFRGTGHSPAGGLAA